MAIKYYSGINISGSIVPSADSTFNLGGPAFYFANVYADNLHGDGSNITNVGSAESALTLTVTVKNKSGGSLAKGTVVHAAPSANPPSGNIIEVIAADYDTVANMPGLGVLNETLANDAEGEAVMFGAVSGIDTSSFLVGTELYVGNNGALTGTKPTATNQLIQKIAVVIKSHATNGLIKVFGAGRTNDVPNEIDRTIQFDANQRFTDNSLILMGGGDMFQIGHKASYSQIATYEGNLYIDNNANDFDIVFRSDDGNGGLATYYYLDGSEGLNRFSKNILLSDDVSLSLGNGFDLKLLHNGTASYIDNSTGNLTIRNLADDSDVIISSDNGSGGTTQYFRADGGNGSVVLYHYGSRKFETTSDGAKVSGDLEVTGDFTVSGTTTFIDTTHLNVGDNIITLNADLSGSTAPTENAGISVYRGSSSSVSFEWDETNDRWTVGSESLTAATFIGNLTGDVTGNLIGDVTVSGDLTGTEASSLIYDFIADGSYEGAAFYNPDTFNAYAGADHWASITLTNAFASNRTSTLSSIGEGPFNYGGNTWSPYFNAAEDEMVIEIDHTSQALKHHAIVGIQFTNTSWRANRIKIEAYNGTAWSTGLDTTSNTATTASAKFSLGGAGIQKLKITLGDPQNSTGGYIRISKIFGYDYQGVGSRSAKASGTYYIEKYRDNSHYSNIYPETDSTYSLGTSVKKYLNVYADNFNGGSVSATTGTFSSTVNLTAGTLQMNGSTVIGNNKQISALGASFTNPVTIYDTSTSENPRLSMGRQASESINFDVGDVHAVMYFKQDTDSNADHIQYYTIDSNSTGDKKFIWQNRAADGTSSSTKLILDADGLDLRTGGYQIGDVTVIDSSRNITAGTVSGTTATFGQVRTYNDTHTDRRFTINQNSGEYPRIYNYDEGDGTFHSIKIGGGNNETSGIVIDGSGNVTIHGTLDVSGTIDLSDANLDIGSADIIFGIDDTDTGARGLVWNFDGDGDGTAVNIGYIRAGGTVVGEKMQFNMNSDGSVTGSGIIYQFMNAGTNVFTVGANGNTVVNGDFTSEQYIQAKGYLYTRSHLRVLNAAETGWKTWATRNNGDYDLDVSSVTASSFIKSGGTSSQFLKADGSVDSNTYLTGSHNHDDRYYTETESDDKFAPVKRGSVTLSKDSYTRVARVEGNNLASTIRMTVHGTTGNIVVNCLSDISVNHSADIIVHSQAGNYSSLDIKIISDNNEDFDIYLQYTGSSSAGTSFTAAIEIFPLNNETITYSPTATAYSGTTFIHTATPGQIKWGQSGQTPNIYLGSNKVYHAGNDGSGSGLDADTLDGQHASAFLTSLPSHTHSAADITSGTLSGDRLPWANNDGFTGTYPLVWKASNTPYTASWLKVNGTTDVLHTRGINLDGNISFTGDSRYIDLSGGTTNAQNALIIGEQNTYGVRFRWDSGSALQFDGYWNTSTTGTENRDLGYIDVNNRIWYLNQRVQANESLRAPIFYDSDSTGYYLNPAGASNLNDVTASAFIGPLYREDNRTISPSELGSGRMRFGFGSFGNNNTSPYSSHLHMRSYTDNSGGNDLLVVFKKANPSKVRVYSQTYGSSSAYSSYIDLIDTSTDDQVKSGYFQSNESLRAPIFYDSNDTNYYINPAGVSNINELHGSGKEIFDATDDSYLRINQSASFSSGCWFGDSNRLSGNTYIAAGGNGGTTSSRVYILGGTYTGTNVIKIDGSSGIVQTTTDSMRAPRFYDYNDTTYYADPAGTSVFNTITVTSGTINMNNNDGFVYDDGANVMKVKYDGTTYNIWTQANDGSGSGLDADLLDGNHGTYFDHRRYTDSNNYLGGYYVSGGTEKPNSSVFGAGKLKIAMLRGGSNNLGFGGTWNDVLWMSTYTGGDVKRSTALVSSKYDNTSLWIAKQAYDSASWGTGYLIWNSGNDGSGSGLDADLLDGVQGSSFLRSDADDTVSAGVTYTWNSTDTHGLQFTNASYGTSLYVGGWSTSNSTNISRLRTSSGNFHLDSASNGNIYLNHYSGGIAYIGNGGGHTYMYNSARSPIFYDSDNTARYLNPAGDSILSHIRLHNHCSLESSHGRGFRFWNSNSYKIHMSGSTQSTHGGRVAGETTSDYNMYFTMSGGTNRGFVFKNANSSSGGNCVAGIDASGNGRFIGDVIAYSSSDKRLKDNITPINNAIDKVQKISGVTFDWNDKQDTYKHGMHDVGVIAQEIEEVLPEVVDTRENGYKAVKYEKIVPLLIEAIKEQQKQIDELKKLINP